MRAAGLPDWVAASEDEFVSKACAIAADLPTLARLRAGLREQLLTSPLFDARRFARDFESLLLSLWRKTGLPRLAKQKPAASTKGKTSQPQKGKSLTAARPDPAAQRAAAINAEYAACVTLYQQGRSAEALPRIRALAEQLPQSAPVWKVLGAVLSAVGQKQEALAAKRRAVELDPNDPDAQANLGNSLQDEDLLEEAEAHCRAALQVNPQHDNALNNLGLVLYRQGRYREALDVLQQALVHSPDFAEAMVNLGNVKRDLGEKTEAEQLYRRAIRLAPRLVNAHMNLGVLLAEGKDAPTEQRPAELAEAEACYQQALAIDPNHVETLHGLGNLYREMRRFKRAEECFQRAVEPEQRDTHLLT
jgi:tetratricopeptide (TPR) repeat protein